MSLVEDVRPISRTKPSTCWKTKYSERSDTRDHVRRAIIAGQRR